MKNGLLYLFAGTALACSPIPELLFAVQGVDTSDMGDMSIMRMGRSDMGTRPTPDLAGPASPCPIPFGATVSYCYSPGAADSLNLETALELSPAATGCDLTKNVLTVSATGVVCSAAFVKSISSAWGFVATKPIFLAFSYSTKQPPNYATLSVNMPVGSPNEVIKVNAISGSQNVINLYSPMGTMFDPGINLTLGGSAKKATLTADWISVWQ